MSDDEHTIRIDTDGLAIDLNGTRERVREAYLAVRPAVIDAFTATLTAPADSSPASDPETAAGRRREGRGGDESGRDTPVGIGGRRRRPQRPTRDASFVQLVVHRPSYTKVCLLERRQLADSFLAGALNPAHLGRMYVDAPTHDRLDEKLSIGETLWRELTPAGRREVEASDSPDSEESTD